MPKTLAAIPAAKVVPAVSASAPTRIVPGGVGQYPPTSIEKRGSGSYVPPAQQERILHRHVIGQSVRKISREEHRDFRTVAKVIRNNPARWKEHLEAGRALFYALTTHALETIRRAMEDGDAQLAYRLLVDAGVVPKPGETSGLMESIEVTLESLSNLKVRPSDFTTIPLPLRHGALARIAFREGS
jgi:hypothetical protein